MDSLVVFGLVATIFVFITFFKKVTSVEIKIRRMYCDKVEDEQRNMYTLSESHQLLMERVRIQDMELFDDFLPMQQQFQLEKWYTKVYRYSCKYFQSLNVIEESQKNDANKVVNLAERAQPAYKEYTEHQSE